LLEHKHLIALANSRMPFGKYAGYVLIDVPEDYLLWLAGKGWPEGQLGQLLVLALEIKTYDQAHVLDPLRGMAL
jgi:hypothetical protein